jgi:hypothetical protein
LPAEGAHLSRTRSRWTLAAAVCAALASAPCPGLATQDPGAAPKPKSAAAPRKIPVAQLKTRLDLRDPFNLGQGKVRIVAFLSPTCSHCIANAATLQQTLEKNPSKELALHIVWVKILDTDTRAAVDKATTVLKDGRAQHYWDQNSLLNAQLLDAIMFDVGVRMYDVFLLYDRTATWDQRLPRPPYWMHEYRGAPGPAYDPQEFAKQIDRALANQPLAKPR